ncbi:biliverdin-producing heme oxygenase [Pacificimonas flava]|uniref:Heme oxygenase n=1 Tax=Pacificimonas flava TaxID=1234595 RepID=M2U4S3_9SPHN|nr:biliverdin-producing heme oxygenase [Pacificimonas flava]EMD82983.1 hypothetical protein C725_1581 [Pacificimonas flava]MBB5280143.1 heme oxygenase [Pacificimonas flava]
MTESTRNLRLYLREHTAADHAETDAAFGSLDLGSRAGYVRFLRAHEAALSALELARGALSWPQELPAPIDAAPLVRKDLAALDTQPSAALAPVRIDDPVGLTYVLAGSRFGNKLIRKSLERAEDSAVRAASSYVGSEDLDAYGRAFFSQLARFDGGDRRDAALQSAHTAFRTFQEAFNRP